MENKNTEPKFEITKEQIIILNTYGNRDVRKCMQEWFPEAFENVLEVGRWYKWNDNGTKVLWKITKIENKCIYCYGFVDGKYIEDGIGYSKKHYKEACDKLKESTTEEVTEALKKEALKRGIKSGAFIIRGFDDNLKDTVIDCECYPNDTDWFYHHEDDCLEHYGFVVYSKGQWASVVKTKTIQEAEKLLKELGHEFKIV